MISAGSFLEEARLRGLDFYAGVPCSFLTPIINHVISDRGTDYVGAASEGEAVAIAAGAWLAGRGTVVMCQNSGLGNAINPLSKHSCRKLINWKVAKLGQNKCSTVVINSFKPASVFPVPFHIIDHRMRNGIWGRGWQIGVNGVLFAI